MRSSVAWQPSSGHSSDCGGFDGGFEAVERLLARSRAGIGNFGQVWIARIDLAQGRHRGVPLGLSHRSQAIEHFLRCALVPLPWAISLVRSAYPIVLLVG
jgi:hypothetical protein